MHPIQTGNYVLPTPALEAFVNVCLNWIESNIPGALVPAPQRFGKSYAIAYFVRHASRLLKRSVGVISAEVGYHQRTSEAQFFYDLLTSGKRTTSKKRPEERRALFVGTLVEAGANSAAQKVVVFLDEANLLDEMMFKLLISVDNEVRRLYGIKVLWILVGQPELETFVSTFLASGQRQIIGRFMTDTYHFQSMNGPEDIKAALHAFDTRLRHPEQGPTFTQAFAPAPFAAGFRLAHSSDLISQRLVWAREQSGLPEAGGIVMQGFTNLVEHLILNTLPELRAGDDLTALHIDTAIAATNCMLLEQQEMLLTPGKTRR